MTRSKILAKNAFSIYFFPYKQAKAKCFPTIVFVRINTFFIANYVHITKSTQSLPCLLKFSFSEKATKTCANVLMVLKFTYVVNVKTMTTIAKISMAFSEKLNFIKSKF